MDTHYNKFKVTFHEKKHFQIKEIKFYNDYKDIPDNEVVTIEENRLISIKFECEDKSAKLYMDGLNILPMGLMYRNIEDLGNDEIFIKPSNEEIPIYDEESYPLIPGLYSIRVIINNMIYYSLYKVINKLISEDESDTIKRELENDINGVTFDFIRRNFSVAQQGIISEMPVMFSKFSMLDNKFHKIINSLMELQNRANYKINNRYKVVPQEKVRNIDVVTIKGYLSNSVKQGFMQVPIRAVEYDLPENRWTKKISEEIIYNLNEFLKEINRITISKQNKIKNIERYSMFRSNNIELIVEKESLDYANELKVKAIRMKSSIMKLTQWCKLLGECREWNIPHVLIQDSRYNILYKVYRKLHDDNFNVQNNHQYSIQWKRTDKLYEMWCYLKICKIIRDDLGYNGIDGWIFDKKSINSNHIIQDLDNNTIVKFEKDNIKINFCYDYEIPKDYKETDFYNNPIYTTSSNNRPDGRLDIYKDDMYFGSIIFEFKYRYREDIWRENRQQFYKEKSTERQLRAYRNDFDSYYILKRHNEKNVSGLRAVETVFVLYPKSKNKNLSSTYYGKDERLKFIKMKPNENTEILIEQIKSQIQKILERKKT